MDTASEAIQTSDRGYFLAGHAESFNDENAPEESAIRLIKTYAMGRSRGIEIKMKPHGN